MWNHLWIYNTMLLSNCLLNLDLIYEKSPSNIHEPSKTNMLTPQNVMSQMLPQCTLLYPVFSLLVSYTHFPKDFRTMTLPSTHFYGLRKCHLSQSSLAIYGSFSEISFNSSSNFLFKPNNTILSDKVRSGRTILSFFLFNWKVIHTKWVLNIWPHPPLTLVRENAIWDKAHWRHILPKCWKIK